jgi:high-affinity iron transporter
MNLIHAAAVFALLASPTAQDRRADPAPVVLRLAATATLAAQEYGLGVSGGRIVMAAEVEEARLFLVEARRSAAQLPPEWSQAAVRELDELIGLVERVAPPDEVASRVRRLTTTLAAGLGVSLDDIPERAPSLARGAEVFQAQCAQCHGSLGRGDGVQAASLDPVPANLAEPQALRDRSPLDFYRRITIGVVGTAMPAYEATLSTQDRWAVAAYASLLRLPPPRGDVPPALASLATSARMSDAAVATELGGSADDSGMLARVAAVRGVQPMDGGVVAAATFAEIRRQIDEALRLAGAGNYDEASARAFDSYMTFERVEREVRAKNPALALELEAAFASLRTRTAGGAMASELTEIRGSVLGSLEKAERSLGNTLSPGSLFVQSVFLILREGLEAILIIGALLTFLVKTGAASRRRDIHVGVGAALIASLVTALLIETVFQVSKARQEVLEGVTMLAAAVVLFYVSYWLLSKIEVARWTDFVRSRVNEAVTSGSALALASAAFLAVYREGFETVLFYKALVLAGPPGQTVVPVLAGLGLGAMVLVAVYIAINRFGVRLPLKPFFALTGLFLYYMAFVFTGRGVAELQEGGLIPTTVLPWAPRVPALGIYPTVESLSAQMVLVVLLVGAMIWSFGIAPHGRKVTGVMVPDEPLRPAPVNAMASVDPAEVEGHRARETTAPAARQELVRSLERMEADLAALQSEVERMRDQLGREQRERVRGPER